MAKETINRNGRKTGEAVAATIRRRIANGELAVGDRLPTEDELTEAFGIARTTLREALRILEFQGLIHIRRGRGGGATVTMPDLVRLAEPLAVVLQLRKTTTADLDAARVLMEPHLAGELALHHTDEDLAALRAVLAKASAAAEAADADAFGTAAAELHVTLIQRGGNETLSVLSQLLNQLILERYKIGAHKSDQALLRRAARSYQRLYGYIEAGDAARAATHWEKQMQWVSASTGKGELLDVFDDKLLKSAF
jgi:GntR family transcriptional regulator, transcriptional repressor for pyruvate dehydrogenase complex